MCHQAIIISFLYGNRRCYAGVRLTTPAQCVSKTSRRCFETKCMLITVLPFISDINECTGNPCHHNATCRNNKGGHTCHCKNGFNGNGTHCSGKYLFFIYLIF